jgi:hypothetical protein
MYHGHRSDHAPLYPPFTVETTALARFPHAQSGCAELYPWMNEAL